MADPTHRACTLGEAEGEYVRRRLHEARISVDQLNAAFIARSQMERHVRNLIVATWKTITGDLREITSTLLASAAAPFPDACACEVI